MEAAAGLTASLRAKLIHPKAPARVHQIRVPWLGRFMYTSDPGDARHSAAEYLQTRLAATHRDGDGRIIEHYDLGSGLVQQNFVVALMQDNTGTTNNHAAPILQNANKYMYSGTGVAANTYDFQLGSSQGPASGLITPTLGYVSGNTTLGYVGTITYAGSFTITEWGLFNANVQGTQSTSTVNTWNAQGQATATWGTSLGASANLLSGYVCVVTAGTTGLFIISNTTTTAGVVVGSVSPTTAYYALTAAGGSIATPSTNATANIYPLMSDHKTFGAINVISGDSIQFTYTLTIQSGG